MVVCGFVKVRYFLLVYLSKRRQIFPHRCFQKIRKVNLVEIVLFAAMGVRWFTVLSILVLASSCRNIRNATSKDVAGRKNAKPVVKNTSPKFLENIQLQPGSVQTNTNHKGYQTTYTAADKTLMAFDIEKANWLQIRYAIYTDASVERMQNLPLLQQIHTWWGTKYCMGGNSVACIDCSGFTTAIFRDVYGKQLPRTAQEQFDAAERVEAVSDLREGDLVFFSNGGRINHVGVYLTNNKFVHASTSMGVTISDLNERYWAPRFRGGRRWVK